jgi:hypothetical protein
VQLMITIFGLLGTFIVSFSKNMKVQKYGMYSWLASNVIAIPYFFIHDMDYLAFLNIAYASISIMGITKRNSTKRKKAA